MKLTKSFRPFYIVNFSLLKTSSTHKRHKVLKRKQKDRATVNRNPKRKWRQVVTRQKLCPPRQIVWFLLAATSNHVPPTQTFLGVRHAFVGQERVTNCLGSYQAPTILDKINGKPRPPSPPKKWRVFALRAASSLFWWGWGFAVPFYFVQDCSSSRRKMLRQQRREK